MQKTAQAKALPDPSLSFGYFLSPVETRVGPQRAKFSLVQMFPWFGTNGAKASVYEFNAQAKYQDFLDRKNRLFYQVKSAYYPIYEVREQILWQKENLEILNTYKRLATTKFSNGKGAMVDVIRVDIMIDEVSTNIEVMEGQLRPLEVAFNRLLNRPDSSVVHLQDNLQLQTTTERYDPDSVLASNPLLQSVDLKIEGAKAMEESAVRQGLPSFGVGIDYVIVDERSDTDMPDNGKNVLMPMVTMSLPIFRGKYKASVKEAQLSREALVAKKQELVNDLISSLESTMYQMETAQQMGDLYDIQITKTRQAIGLLNTAYANESEELVEILRMEQQLLKYKIAKARAVRDYYLAEARLDYIKAK
jgi:outer membrane protein TolC